jgi:hypothetical protein
MDQARQEIGDLAESEEDALSYAIFGPVAREFLERRRAGGMPASDPTVAVIATMVAEMEGLIEPAASGQGTCPRRAHQNAHQMALAPSAWRAGTRPRIRQLGGLPKW